MARAPSRMIYEYVAVRQQGGACAVLCTAACKGKRGDSDHQPSSTFSTDQQPSGSAAASSAGSAGLAAPAAPAGWRRVDLQIEGNKAGESPLRGTIEDRRMSLDGLVRDQPQVIALLR
jgi:hypothetical protein